MIYIVDWICSSTDTVALSNTHLRILPKKRKRKLIKSNQNSIDFALFGDNKNRHSEARKMRQPILYAFPSFDKCDSLLYFPSTFTRHLNSSDFKSLSKLFCSYLDINCNIDLLRYPIKPTVKNFTAFLEITNSLFPDQTMCVHNTKVVGNQIHSTIYSKHTECRAIYNALQRNNTHDEIQESMIKLTDPQQIKARLLDEPISDQFRQDVFTLIDTGDDLVIYLKFELTLTLDEMSKKIVSFCMDGTLTEVKPVPAIC